MSSDQTASRMIGDLRLMLVRWRKEALRWAMRGEVERAASIEWMAAQLEGWADSETAAIDRNAKSARAISDSLSALD
jgi:hypothetical protein